MEAYYDVITLMKAANNYDIEDYGILSNSVGDKNLIGAEIVPRMNAAKAEEESYLAKREEMYEGMNEYSNWYDTFWYSYYFYRSKYYDYMASWAHDEYVKYKTLADEFDRINVETSVLFSESTLLRNSAVSALDFLGRNYSSGQYGSLSGVRSHWLDPYNDLIEESEELSRLRDKLNISAEEYQSLSENEKVQYMIDAQKYTSLLVSDMDLLPGDEIKIFLSENIVMTYSVEASINGESCNGNFGINSSGNIVEDINLDSIDIETEVDLQKEKLMEATIGFGDGGDSETICIVDLKGVGIGTRETIGNDTYECIVATNLISETSSLNLITSIDTGEATYVELESDLDITTYEDDDRNLKPDFEYVPAMVPEESYDRAADLGWMALGGAGAIGGAVVLAEGVVIAAPAVTSGATAVTSGAAAAGGAVLFEAEKLIEELLPIFQRY